MNAFIYCTEQNKQEIREVVIDKLNADSVVFANVDALSIDFFSKDVCLVIEHELVSAVKTGQVDDLLKGTQAYVFYKGRIFNIHKSDDLINERKQHLDAKAWEKAKVINDILCDMDFLLKNTVNNSYPSFFQLESTDFCNSKCIMCEHYYNENKGACSLGMEKIEYLRDAIQLSRIINLNGMGEPFISKNIKDQIDLYVGYGNKIVANTNMSYLDDGLIERIGRSFDWLAISIDGAIKETYESIRINLSYDKLISNLYKLKEKVPNIYKIISMVIMRQNVTEMPDLVELAYKVGANQVVFLNLNPSILIGNHADVMSNYPKVLEYYSVKALEKGEKLGIRVVVATVPNLNREITFDEISDELKRMNAIPKWKTLEEEEKMKETSQIVDRYLEQHSQLQFTTVPTKVKCSGVCDWLLTNCYTDQHGNVSMCCRNSIYRAGTVAKEEGFKEVWNSPLMQKAREIFYSGYLPESCLKCGMVELGELKYLKVDICPEFYEDGEVKEKQKKIFKEIFGDKLRCMKMLSAKMRMT